MGSQPPCIYRVPSQLREVKPGAYRPRMVLIGPLNHLEKPKDYADSRYIEYAMMEDQKVIYKDAFTERPNGAANIEKMKSIIEEEKENIRASYAVSTKWISNKTFVELILNDSIFIVEFILRTYETTDEKIIGDLIVDNPFYSSTVTDDLALLENQLHYFYLNKLWTPIIKEYFNKEDETPEVAKQEDEIMEEETKRKFETLDEVILMFFSVDGMVRKNTKFNHFTDMFRCVYKESLGQILELNNSEMAMQNADKLSSVGVEFKVRVPDSPLHRECSLEVSFKKGCLTLPRFDADEAANIILRNVIAYEQCHDPKNAFATNYVHLMNFLITTNEDVNILTSAGVLTNGVGRPSMVLEMVNNLIIGVLLANSQYHGIVDQLNTHYKSHRKRMWAKLKRVYFSDMWTSTATSAAIFLLLLTLVGTVASVVQAIKAFEK